MDEYICLFCGKSIKPSDILFVYDGFSEYYKDKVRYDFIMRCSSNYPLDNGDMFKGLYFRATEDVVSRRDSNGFPTMADVRHCNGLAPEELVEHGGGFGISDYAKPIDSGETFSTVERACPNCHCRLPIEFGTIPTITITLFGGRASGKTAFLIAMLQQLNVQLDTNQLGSTKILPESAAYMKPQMDFYVQNHGITMPTPNQRLFPIIMIYSNAYGKSSRSCFIAMHDIAGEGLLEDNYLANHEGIKRASIMMLMIDPNQVNSGAYHNASTVRQSISNSRVDVNLLEQHEYFSDKVGIFLHNRLAACKELAMNVRHVIAVLTKLDLPFTYDKSLFGASQNIMLKRDIEHFHQGAVNRWLLDRIDDELNRYFLHYLRTADIKTLIKNQFPDRSDMDISLMAVSTYTLRKEADGQLAFVNAFDDKSAKHRIIEPFLRVLLLAGMVDSKDGQPIQNPVAVIGANGGVERKQQSRRTHRFLWFGHGR